MEATGKMPIGMLKSCPRTRGVKPWVEANCEFTYRSAAGYMKAAQQKCNALHFSSLREALGYGTKDTLARG